LQGREASQGLPAHLQSAGVLRKYNIPVS